MANGGPLSLLLALALFSAPSVRACPPACHSCQGSGTCTICCSEHNWCGSGDLYCSRGTHCGACGDHHESASKENLNKQYERASKTRAYEERSQKVEAYHKEDANKQYERAAKERAAKEEHWQKEREAKESAAKESAFKERNGKESASKEAARKAPCLRGTFGLCQGCSCTACGAGQYQDDDGVPGTCSAITATYDPRNQNEVCALRAGHPPSSLSCKDCPVGKYGDSLTQTRTSCTTCPAGSYNPYTVGAASAAGCLPCVNDTNVCAFGWHRVGCHGALPGACRPCDELTACDATSYLPEQGACTCKPCIVCPPGHLTVNCTDGSSGGVCVACPDGHYAIGTGFRRACSPCDPNLSWAPCFAWRLSPPPAP